MRNGYRVTETTTTIYLERHDGTVLKTLVSTCDLPKLKALDVMWVATLQSGKFYAVGHTPDGVFVALARVVLDAGAEDLADHINGDTLNNTRVNLRLVDRSRNCLNLPFRSRGRSGFRNVYAPTGCSRFEARIHIHGKSRILGYRQTAEEAGRLVLEALREHDPIAAANYERFHFPQGSAPASA